MAEATQAQIRAAELLESLWNDAEVGEKVRKAAKAKFSDTKIVDDVVAPFVEPLRAESKALKDRLDKMEADAAAERAEREKTTTQANFEQAIAAARQNYNLTDEGFDKMIARMKETGNYADADAAAAWVASKTPPVAVPGPTWAPQDMNYFGTKNHDDALAELHRNPIKYQDDQLAEFYKNPDKFVQETLGG
jgi:hypothetical protein